MEINRRSSLFVIATGLSALAAGCSSPAASPPNDPPRLRLRVPATGEALVLDGHVRAVRLVRDPERDGIALSVDLDDAIRRELATFTGKHVGEHVATEVRGRTIALLVVRDPIDAPALLLTARDDESVREMEREISSR